jgi:hypothetical protein
MGKKYENEGELNKERNNYVISPVRILCESNINFIYMYLFICEIFKGAGWSSN